METFKEIISSSTPTLVDFFATWCGPCKAMSPVLDQLKEQMGGTVRVIKIDFFKGFHSAKIVSWGINLCDLGFIIKLLLTLDYETIESMD